MLKALRRWLDSRPQPDSGRWVVLDVEASGLDKRHDRLLAIAAVAVVHVDGAAPRIVLGDSFEVVLRQGVDSTAGVDRADKANILLHGIGVGAQRGGVAPDTALAALEAFVGTSPLIAYHAAFDRAMIDRACSRHLHHRLPNPWLDLAPVAALLHPEVRAKALDEWLAHFGILCAVRHQAAADTLATAELLLKLWPAVRRQVRKPGFAALADLAAQRRWVPAG
jgi:DNA polymerase III subunit epsilon